MFCTIEYIPSYGHIPCTFDKHAALNCAESGLPSGFNLYPSISIWHLIKAAYGGQLYYKRPLLGL